MSWYSRLMLRSVQGQVRCGFPGVEAAAQIGITGQVCRGRGRLLGGLNVSPG
jgi:hypothetical protein